MSTNRSIGAYSVIGIRPTIDGRRGYMKVRESLEEQTMNMAKSAATLFRENPFYSNGEPVNIVIVDSTIGWARESVACADKFRRAGVDITLTVTPCRRYNVETMDMDPHTIKGAWGSNGTERPGAVYPASMLVIHVQKGLPALSIYGHDVQDADDTGMSEDVKEKLPRFGRAAVAVATMRGKSYFQIGPICTGIGGSIIDPAFTEGYLGVRVESVDEVELIRRMSEEIYDKEEFEKALVWIGASCKEGFDKNPPEVRKTRKQKDRDWKLVTKMMCIIKDLMNGNPNLPEGRGEERVEHNATAAGFQEQRQRTDFYPNGDFAEPMLNSSFGWSGAREPYILATENDTLNGLGMLFTKPPINRAQIFADARTYQSPEAIKKVAGYDLEGVAKEAGGFLHLIDSGAAYLGAMGKVLDRDEQSVMKPWYEVTADDQRAMMKATTWNEADFGYLRNGGYSSRYVTEVQMPRTIIRSNLVEGLGPTLQIAEGWTVKLPDDVTDILWKRTDYTWPCTWFAPRATGRGAFASAYDVMNNWGANHGAISYGHIGADLITLCLILRVPVSTHNMPEERILRPVVWNVFGMDKEGQDLRVCTAHGPLYK